MFKSFKRLALTLAVAVAMCLPMTAQAATPTANTADAAGTFVLDVTSQAFVMMMTPDEAERNAALLALFNENFAVHALGRFALGQYVRSASAEQLSAYDALFGPALVRTYAGQLKDYANRPLSIQRVRAGRKAGQYAVYSQLANGNQPLELVWLVEYKDGKFLIKNVSIEGINVASMLRDAYSSVAGNQGMDALIARLRDITGA